MNRYLVYLEWPEKCFRTDAEALRLLRTLVPKGSVVTRTRTEAHFLRELPHATHAIVWHFKAEWYARATRLRVVATPGAGRELVSQAAPEGVVVHFGHFHGAIIAETVVGFILAWARGFFRPERAAERWSRVAMSDTCYVVAGTRAVIAGYGRIGRAIGAKLAALGVQVAGFSRANAVDLPQAAKTADWFIMALPSDTGTDDFLNAALLRKLPRRCVVVNVGRGNAVDETALVAALTSGRLAGAYLDVFKGEPGPLRTIVGDAGANGILATPPDRLPWNLIRTPHGSAFAKDYLRRFFQELKDDRVI